MYDPTKKIYKELDEATNDICMCKGCELYPCEVHEKAKKASDNTSFGELVAKIIVFCILVTIVALTITFVRSILFF